MAATPSQQARRFFKISLLILTIIVISDQLIGRTMEFLYFKQKSGLLYRTTFAIDSTKADYIVLGSSRANHDYDPSVFEKNLHKSFYNCGRDRQGLLYSCAVLSGILERYTPKFIIIDIRLDEFTQADEGTLSTLLPYAQNKAVARYFRYNSRFENVKLISKIYPYNSLLTNLVVGLNKRWSGDNKGYVPLASQCSDTPVETFSETGKPDTLKMQVFERLLSVVNDRHIPVLLVISPIRYKCLGQVTINECLSLERSYSNTRFLNFTNQRQWENFNLYSDNNHLNSRGASLYSYKLSKYLQR